MSKQGDNYVTKEVSDFIRSMAIAYEKDEPKADSDLLTLIISLERNLTNDQIDVDPTESLLIAQGKKLTLTKLQAVCTHTFMRPSLKFLDSEFDCDLAIDWEHYACSHNRAPIYFAYSISDCRFDPPTPNGHICTMGYHVNSSCRGDYKNVTTLGSAPFCDQASD